ncbi:MAG: bifunctional DNA primase/polymerase [Treponema sp.]|jgi:hypothetical protein|nr:bifunctional DNA primase/polymerase [Treponema sp.]
MIAAFVADKMSAYVSGGMKPETAAYFTRGELLSIYRRQHNSRDKSGIWQLTQPPENITTPAAMTKCDEAITAFTDGMNKTANTAPEESQDVYRGSAAIKHTLAAGIPIKYFYEESKDNDPSTYTTDLQKIGALWNEGQRRFKAFINGRFLAMDIDRKPGKPDGLEAFYRMFPRETLPAELQGLPDSFPCYVQTPSGGFHLYFKYKGQEVKLRELAQGVEVKEKQITAPGSRRENGDYILHGELNKAPPLYGLIIDRIEETKKKKEQAKAERSKPRTKAAADRPVHYDKPRITLDDLAQEAVSAYGGHHDRQVSFAGRACRCKFSGAETLSYVKSRHDVFGNDSDTENTVLSVFRDNGAA